MEPIEPKTESPRRKRRWFQYSLRTLLVVMLLVSIGLSWFAVKMEQAKKQQEAMAAIKELGGWATYADLRESAEPQRGPEWLHQLLGDDFFWNVQSAGLPGKPVTDADLEQLKALPRLRYLDLGTTSITDASLEHIQGLS